MRRNKSNLIKLKNKCKPQIKKQVSPNYVKCNNGEDEKMCKWTKKYWEKNIYTQIYKVLNNITEIYKVRNIITPTL